jgi:hypothetical protein
MKTLSEIKRELFHVTITDPSKESKYGKFLDKLVFEYDQRGKDENWDLWYFSDNTEFCRDSAKHYLNEIEKQFSEHHKWYNALEQGELDTKHDFRADKFRRLFGCFCFYLYAALESFAHEINIFYELGERRRDVSIKRIKTQLARKGTSYSLLGHLDLLSSDPELRTFFEYRDAIMHGYVYPLSFTKEAFFVKGSPKDALFSFSNININLLDFCKESYSKVNAFICKGWRYFEIDELSSPEGAA